MRQFNSYKECVRLTADFVGYAALSDMGDSTVIGYMEKRKPADIRSIEAVMKIARTLGYSAYRRGNKWYSKGIVVAEL